MSRVLTTLKSWVSSDDAGDGGGRRELILLASGFVALVIVGVAAIWIVKQNAEYAAQGARTLEAKAEIVQLLSLAQDAETGQRGYLLTNDERYLGPYKAAVENIMGRLDRVRQLVGTEGTRGAHLDALAIDIKAKLDELAETVTLQRDGKIAEARAVVDTERGRNAMRAIRRNVREMLAEEDAAYASRSSAADRTARALVGVTVLGLLVAAALAFLAQLLVRRQTARLADAQTALRQANTGLEAAVAERTVDLVAANQEIQRFAYIVSHDLRAPLVNVMGFTSELDAARKTLKTQIDGLDEVAAAKVSAEARLAIEEDLPEAIGFIRTSTSKMDRLINAILRLSREGSRTVKPEQVSVEQLVSSIADTIYQQMQAADAEITIVPGLPQLVTDKFSIEQIFQNLIENAVKYLDRSRPGRITVRGRRIGAMVEYAIEDNGRGIDAKDHERVFELFRRAGAQDQAGEGLGLAFVRASVRRLGGGIRLTSEPGRGSTFHLTFPAVLLQPSESRPA